jgi:hypothetical protein
MNLADAAEKFFMCATGVARAMQHFLPDELLEIRSEEFLRHPGQGVSRLCDFVGLPCPAGYRDACTAFVWPQPHESRRTVTWPRELRDEITERLKEFPWFGAYHFDA